MGQLEIINFLKSNKGVWFNLDQIANLCGMNYPQTSKCINKILSNISPHKAIVEQKTEFDYRVGSNGTKTRFVIKYFRIK